MAVLHLLSVASLALILLLSGCSTVHGLKLDGMAEEVGCVRLCHGVCTPPWAGECNGERLAACAAKEGVFLHNVTERCMKEVDGKLIVMGEPKGNANTKGNQECIVQRCPNGACIPPWSNCGCNGCPPATSECPSGGARNPNLGNRCTRYDLETGRLVDLRCPVGYFPCKHQCISISGWPNCFGSANCPEGFAFHPVYRKCMKKPDTAIAIPPGWPSSYPPQGPSHRHNGVPPGWPNVEPAKK